MALNFWSGMVKRVGLKLTDKLMVGNVDNGEAEYIDIQELGQLLVQGSDTKDGYRWLKNVGNATTEYQIGEEIQGVGDLFPGYWVHGYIIGAPMTDPVAHIKIISSVKI